MTLQYEIPLQQSATLGRESGQGSRLPFPLAAALLVFVLGLVGAAAAIGLASRPDQAALGWSLLAFVTVASFARPRLREGIVAGVGAAAVFAVLVLAQHSAAGVGQMLPLAASIAVTGLVLCVAPFTLRFLTRELQHSLILISEQQQVIDGLSRRDEATGAYRPGSLTSFLQEEVERGRRSQRAFTVCLVALDRWSELVDDLGLEDAQRVFRKAIAMVGASQRMLDKVVDLGGGQVVLVLPETGLGGAETVAWRIQSKIAAEVPVPVRIGIAEFPRDGVTEDALMSEVRQALEFARTANIPVVDRSLLGAE